ncbi:hypothetical protein TanjilG_06550 [Lupinus angustifolius]|uniref:non-specific serine/threonine protein kinase n=1 Tax=Lupinus angustifolius TaxID=3871 RepID=A0A1J7GFW6_LUPAN|nr:hypothetical protein TanjilG_06550 [Lupinus angustifolius]
MASMPLGPHHHQPPLPSAPPQHPQPEVPRRSSDMETDKDMSATVIVQNDAVTGHIISTTIGGKNGEPKQTISYMAERVVGTGSFGVVFQAKCLETGEAVAIKKVLQDRRYKNRELQLMRLMDHPNVISLTHCFFSTTSRDELFLNLVMEYVPETMYGVLKHYNNMNQRMPLIYIFRGLAYIHTVSGVCHRDVKPQNLLVHPLTHQVKLCDFGSAKVLVKGETNISYICSRYYRAPELIFGATEYTTSVDIWSAGCVLAELLLGQPLFPGENQVDQLVEIIKVLGTPTREEIRCMNPNYTDFRFPQVKAHPWHKVFHKRMPPEAIDLASRLLQYSPSLRCTALEACTHPFFDELREPNARPPNGRPLPPLFNFKLEIAGASPELINRLIPEHVRWQTGLNSQNSAGT